MAKVAFLVAVCTVFLTAVKASGAENFYDSKISSSLKTCLAKSEECDILIVLNAGTSATLRGINSQSISNFALRSATVQSLLQEHSRNTQAELLNFLAKETNGEVRSFWVTNQIFVRKASADLISRIAARDDVARVNPNFRIRLDDINIEKKHSEAPSDYAWGVVKVQAPEVYSLPGGNNGTGIRVAVIDSGVRGTHQDLIENYVGANGWFEPSGLSTEPYDELAHGTHCAGTILGRGGIGVAPGAKWLGCKACFGFWCFVADFISCGQWVICPTLPDGTSSPDCSKTPHIVSNSWGFNEGMGEGDQFYNEVIDAWHAAGIIPIFAQGNEGEGGCVSGRYPGDKANVIGVGATEMNNSLAYFSSRGPSVFGNIKPNIAAPGVDIWSAISTGDQDYAEMSGTSMATPHVSGVVALLLSIEPNLTFDQIATILFKGASVDVIATDKKCGGMGEHRWPNNEFGHGLMNALHSAKLIIGNKRA